MPSAAMVRPDAPASTVYKPMPSAPLAATTKKSAFCASCTNQAVPDRLPSATATSVSVGSQLPFSFVIASVAALPSAICPNAAVAASELQAFNTKVALKVVINGDGNAALPASSASATAATKGMPIPPAASGTQAAVQPSSVICCHRSRSQMDSMSR